jgi:hypothetical protein
VELNGTLHEYLLADVFQLLAQQKATGKLEVRNGNAVGFMVLNEGMIVAAKDGEEGIVKKLTNGIRLLRRAPERDLQKLCSSPSVTPGRFVHEVITRKFISEQELAAIARTTLEDICCSLFGWSQGTYRFDRFDAVRLWTLAGVALPADAVVMEPTGREHNLGGLPRDLTQLFHSPESHVLSMVDGLTSVAGMVEQSCLCEYRVKETLVHLQQAQLITALPEKLSESIKAAMGREKVGMSLNISGLAISMLATVLAVGVIGFLGVFVFQRSIMRTKLVKSMQVRTEIEVSEARQKVTVAALQYHAEFGQKAPSLEELIRTDYLTEQDTIHVSGRGLSQEDATSSTTGTPATPR